jgi:hypothetical protein
LTTRGTRLEYPGQGKVHKAKDIAEIVGQFRARQIVPERLRGEKRAQDQRGERDLDGESRGKPQHTKSGELVQPGPHEAACDEDAKNKGSMAAARKRNGPLQRA